MAFIVLLITAVTGAGVTVLYLITVVAGVFLTWLVVRFENEDAEGEDPSRSEDGPERS